MRRLTAGALLAIAACRPAKPPAPPAVRPPLVAISTDAFRDGANHYRNATGRSDYPSYRADQIVEIAGNILLHQRHNGGWPENWDPQRVLPAAEAAAVAAQADRQDTSFDNRATYPQTEYLAEVYRQTGDARFRDASVRGLEFVLAAQHASGGWPHSFPDGHGYRGHVTFMDDVVPGVLGLLRKAAAGAGPFAFVEPPLRERCAQAVRRGDACILRLQVVVDGQPTVWCGQYDRDTLQPTTARSYELPALVSAESVAVVRYLMSIEQPSPEIVRAVEAAAAWFERSKVVGLRVDRIAAEPVRYQFHSSTWDVVAVADPAAPPLWARFYEIDTNRPFMANRDGHKVYTLAEVDRERRTGYRWYGPFATVLLERDLPAWRQRQAAGARP